MSTDALPLSALNCLPETQAIEISPSPAAILPTPSLPVALTSQTPVQFTPAVEAPAGIHVELFERSRIAESQRPRQWNLEARAASDFLAHSMEYLADSRELPTGRFTRLSAQDAESEAILVLMEAKRQIHQSLPFIERRRKGIFGTWKGVERRKDRQN